MAFKMNNPIGNVANTKSHGTNANYKKSGMKNADGSPVKPGAPGLLGKIMDPLGLFKKGKKMLGGKGKPCPQAAAAAPVDGAAAAAAPPTPEAQGAAPAAAPAAAPVEDPAAAAAPMKEGLMKDSPAKSDKPKHQKGGSYTYKGKKYAEFSKLPDAAKQAIYAKNAPNPKLAKKVYGIKDENRDDNAEKGFSDETNKRGDKLLKSRI
jgi:hypothetical protein